MLPSIYQSQTRLRLPHLVGEVFPDHLTPLKYPLTKPGNGSPLAKSFSESFAARRAQSHVAEIVSAYLFLSDANCFWSWYLAIAEKHTGKRLNASRKIVCRRH
jgi:hypothetical protein